MPTKPETKRPDARDERAFVAAVADKFVHRLTDAPSPGRLLPLQSVVQRTGLSLGEITAAEDFPPPKVVVQGEPPLYDETKIQNWIAHRPELRRERRRGWRARG